MPLGRWSEGRTSPTTDLLSVASEQFLGPSDPRCGTDAIKRGPRAPADTGDGTGAGGGVQGSSQRAPPCVALEADSPGARRRERGWPSSFLQTFSSCASCPAQRPLPW